MLGVIIAFIMGLIGGGIGMVILLAWAFDSEVRQNDKLPRIDKKNMD